MPKHTHISSILQNSPPRWGGAGGGGSAPAAWDAPTQPSPERGRALVFVSSESDFLGDSPDHAINISQHFVVPEADHAVAMGLDHAGSGFIGSVVRMLPTVEFDGDLQATAGEIGNEIADRELACELDAHLPPTQARPQVPFGVRHFPAQPLRNRRQALSRHTSDTPTQPSPDRGRAFVAIAG